MSAAALVLQVKIKAGGVAQLADGGWHDRKYQTVPDLAEGHPGASGDRPHALVGARAQVPVLEQDETNAGVLAGAAEAEALHREHRIDQLALGVEEMILNLVEHLPGADRGRAHRRLHEHQHEALILGGQKRGRQADEQHAH